MDQSKARIWPAYYERNLCAVFYFLRMPKNYFGFNSCQHISPSLKRMQYKPDVPPAFVNVYQRISEMLYTLAYARIR